MTDYGNGVFMQGEGSALLRRVSLALIILWGTGLVSMLCTNAMLQDSSLSALVGPRIYQQVLDSLHGRTSIPPYMLTYAAFGTVMGIVGYRTGRHGGQNGPALVLGIASVGFHALLFVARLPQLNVAGLVPLTLSVLYVYGATQIRQHSADPFGARPFGVGVAPGVDVRMLRRASLVLLGWSVLVLILTMSWEPTRTPFNCLFEVIRLLIGVIGYRTSTRADLSGTRRILLMGIFLTVICAFFIAEDCYLLSAGMASTFPLMDTIELSISILFLAGAIRLHKDATGTAGYDGISGTWEGIDNSRLGW